MLNHWQLVLIAVSLGCDAFSVALAIGSNQPHRGQSFRLSFHFGLFQAMMPVIGWFAGKPFVEWVQNWDTWLASGILTAVALHMLLEAMSTERKSYTQDRSRGWYLVSFSLATSIDALAVGLVFSVMDISPWWPSLVIGLTAGGMTLTGLHLGRKLRASFGRVAEVFGGILLLVIAIKFLTV